MILSMKGLNIRYLFLPLLYLGIGGTVMAMLVQRVLNYANTVWLLLLIPGVMMTVLLTVVGLVYVWLQYRTWREDGLLHQYSMRSITWLCLKCWAVVMSGLTLGVIFCWMHQMLPDYLQELFSHLRYLFYIICTFLTISALMSVIISENLHEIRLRNAQSENQLLKAQLNPHFLYNTLNNIDALIWIDQERASSAVTELSGLMRYMTYSARQEEVSLAEEVSALRQLVELQRLRMGDPEALAFEVTDPMPRSATGGEWRIAPLLLVPLVENCFKHCGPLQQGQETTGQHAISIRLEVEKGELQFMTDNNLRSDIDIETHQKSTPHGVGLTVLRRRLELLYHKRYTFSAQREGNRFRTKLTIACSPRQ